jgi:hypothetical protein
MLDPTKIKALIDSACRGDWEEVCARYLDLVHEACGSKETVVVEALLPSLVIRDSARLKTIVRDLLTEPQPDEFE